MFKGVTLSTIVWWRFARLYEVNLKNTTLQSLIEPSHWVYKSFTYSNVCDKLSGFALRFLNVYTFWSRDGKSFRCDLPNLYQKLPITSGVSCLHRSRTSSKGYLLWHICQAVEFWSYVWIAYSSITLSLQKFYLSNVCDKLSGFALRFLNVYTFWSREGQSFRCDLPNLYQTLPIKSGASYLHFSSIELKKIPPLAYPLGSWILILYVVLRATENAVTWFVRQLLSSDFWYFKVQNNPYDNLRCVFM